MGLPSPGNDTNNSDSPMEDIYMLDLRLGIGNQVPIVWVGPQSYIPFSSDLDSGRITKGAAHNPIATIKFQLNGEKKIMLNYAKLRIVE